MNLEKFHKILAETPEDVHEHVKMSMDILDRIHELLNKKFDGKQRLLAERLGKSEAEVSKMLSGVKNFTTKTICKLQVAFGEPILAVCTDSNHSTFVQARAYGQENVRVCIDKKNNFQTRPTYHAIKKLHTYDSVFNNSSPGGA